MKVLGWKIWYPTKTVDSTQTTWDAAPDDQVQCVVIYFDEWSGDKPHRRVAHGDEYYALNGDDFEQSFQDRSKVHGAVKHGTYTKVGNLNRILSEAYDDWGEGWLYRPPQGVSRMKPGDHEHKPRKRWH